MTPVILPFNFVSQSLLSVPAQSDMVVDGGGARAVWLQPAQRGAPVHLRLEGLLPHRFYRLRPGDRFFSRTDRSGVLHALLQLDAATLIIVEPVI